jgi:hypothetical protein
MKQFPNELDIDDWGDFEFDDIIYYSDNEERDDTIFFEDTDDLVRHISIKAANENWQIYTQVDSDSGEIVYSKGLRFVNRIGEFALVKKSNYEVDNC